MLQVLTGIFGVGSKTAARWFREEIHSLHQLRGSGRPLNRAQQAGESPESRPRWLQLLDQFPCFILSRLSGLVHYEDLNQPVTRAEADTIGEIVAEAVLAVSPGSHITLTGGFRR